MVGVQADESHTSIKIRPQVNSYGNHYSSRLKGIPPQTVAMDVEPSEAITSELIRTVKGSFSSGGNTARRAFSARVPTNSEATKMN